MTLIWLDGHFNYNLYHSPVSACACTWLICYLFMWGILPAVVSRIQDICVQVRPGCFATFVFFFPVFTYFLVYHFGSAEALHRSEDEYLMIPVEQQQSELSFSSSLSDQSAHEFREAVSYEEFQVWVEVSFSLIVLSSGSVSPLRGKYPPFFSSLSRRVLPYGPGPVESFS